PKRPPVQTGREKSELVLRFINRQAFSIWPRKFHRTLCRAIRKIQERSKLYVLRLRFRPRKVDKFGQREPIPRNHHRPRFHAAMSIVAPLNTTDALYHLVDVDL